MNEKDLMCIAHIFQSIFISRNSDPFNHCSLCPIKFECSFLKKDSSGMVEHSKFYEMLEHLEKETGVYLGYGREIEPLLKPKH